ncbi:MAG: hypothetical protein AAF688_15680 [Bacteroidota bacterium]
MYNIKKTKTIGIILVLLLEICLAFNSELYSQAVLIVDNNEGSGAEYTSAQAAVDAALEGDIIYLQPSPNAYGDIVMSKRLNIFGLAANPELNNGLRANVNNLNFRNANSSGSKVSGLSIISVLLDGSSFINNDIILTNNSIDIIRGNNSTSLANNVIISGNYIRNPNFLSISVKNSQNWIISNNLIEQPFTSSSWLSFEEFNSTTVFNNNIILTRQIPDSNGSIELFNDCTGTQINNNIFIFTAVDVANFNLGNNSGLNFQNNLTFSFNSTLDALSGSNNIDNQDPLFSTFFPNSNLNSTSNDVTFEPGSPALNAGIDGNDLGVFNGGFPFNIRGYPTELPYIRDFVIFNNIISPGTNLEVNVKADANINN